MHITKGSVFYELFDKEKADELELRSQLLIAIVEFAQKRKLTQDELAEILRVSPAHARDFQSWKIDKFSLPMLIKLVMRIGLQIKIVVPSS